MIPRLLFVCALCVLVRPESAAAQPAFDAGVKLGLNITSISSDIFDLGNQANLIAGGFVVVDPANPLAFQIEALYAQKGASSDVPGLDGVEVDYLEVPVLVKFQLPFGGQVLPVAYGGPTFALKLREEVNTFGGFDVTDFVGDAFETFDAGFALGGGVDLQNVSSLGTVVVDLRYTIGLSNLSDRFNIGGTDADDLQNRVFSLMVGLLF